MYIKYITCYDVHVIGAYVHMLILIENKRTEKTDIFYCHNKRQFYLSKMCIRIYSEQKSVKNIKTCSCFVLNIFY